MIAVLSLYRPRLEDRLVARGESIVGIVPESVLVQRSASAGYRVVSVPHWDDYTALAAIAADLEALGVDEVATVDEPCVRAAAFLRGLLGLTGQTHASAVACTDKSVMKRRLAQAGLAVAEHRIVHTEAQVRSAIDAFGGAAVVKPRLGFGSVNTYLIDDATLDDLAAAGAFRAPTDLPDYFAATTIGQDMEAVGYLAERLVEIETEFFCDLLLVDGEPVYCVAGRYSMPILNGDDVGSALIDPDSPDAARVRALTVAAAAALGVRDAFGHCEIFRDREGRWIIGEFAARPGGADIPRLLALNHGIDPFELYAEQLGGVVPVLKPRAFDGVVASRALSAGGGQPIDVEALRAMPGVIEVEVGPTPAAGTQTTQSMYHAGYVYCRGADAAEAEELAARCIRDRELVEYAA